MNKLSSVILLTLMLSLKTFSQTDSLRPENHNVNLSLIKNETYNMSWFMLKDTNKIKIGDVTTKIEKEKEKIVIITTVAMQQSPTKWVDSTIVKTSDFSPLYHSSYNIQRDMVLNFDEVITGYYLDKQSGEKNTISETHNESYFDSNFYPQLIRWLPLEVDYSSVISIFDYNPNKKTGVITATIKNASEDIIVINGKDRKVWKVVTTDDISNNTAISTYYIDKTSRELLKQEIEMAGRKMVMELVE